MTNVHDDVRFPDSYCDPDYADLDVHEGNRRHRQPGRLVFNASALCWRGCSLSHRSQQGTILTPLSIMQALPLQDLSCDSVSRNAGDMRIIFADTLTSESPKFVVKPSCSKLGNVPSTIGVSSADWSAPFPSATNWSEGLERQPRMHGSPATRASSLGSPEKAVPAFGWS